MRGCSSCTAMAGKFLADNSVSPYFIVKSYYYYYLLNTELDTPNSVLRIFGILYFAWSKRQIARWPG
jgi:hypothetical protein